MAEMHEDEYYRIAALEQSHWWYKSLHNLVLATLKEKFKTKDITLIDAGCGTGGLMSFLRKNGYNNIKGFDISDTAVKMAVSKGVDVIKGDLRNVSSLFSKSYADVIICNDNLYFLDESEQRSATGAMYYILKANGLIIANIPALKAFSGQHDRQVGISKRYAKGDIWKTFDAAKFDLVKAVYWPFLLSFIIGSVRILQRMRNKFSKNISVRSDLNKVNSSINSLLFTITNLENTFFSRKPFGSSLFLIMKAKGS